MRFFQRKKRSTTWTLDSPEQVMERLEELMVFNQGMHDTVLTEVSICTHVAQELGPEFFDWAIERGVQVDITESCDD